MGISPEDIEYWRLPPADRLVLAQDIIDSVLAENAAPPLTSEEIAELDRCCAAVDSGQMPTYAWHDIRERLLHADGPV
jgi:putative addiction module component (TIGR02574 family)